MQASTSTSTTNTTEELAYVGWLPCGCVGMLAMLPQPRERSYARRVEREIAKCVRLGWKIETLPVEQGAATLAAV